MRLLDHTGGSKLLWPEELIKCLVGQQQLTRVLKDMWKLYIRGRRNRRPLKHRESHMSRHGMKREGVFGEQDIMEKPGSIPQRH